VTSRLVPGLRSLRSAAELALVRKTLERARRDEFQVVHHSIQSNHLHLIVEATDRTTLTSGLRGLIVRLARELNRLWQRSGGVFADRFHERELRTPREVRNSLVYVLHNARKHGIWMRGPDPCSSGAEFDGWEPARGTRTVPAAGSAQSSRGTDPARAGRGPESFYAGSRGNRGDEDRAHLARSGPLRRAWTWLLGVGWQRHGLLRESEVPQGAFGRIVSRGAR